MVRTQELRPLKIKYFSRHKKTQSYQTSGFYFFAVIIIQ